MLVNVMRGYVRIIGGKWRGKKLYFPEQSMIRPTTDRIRETLFNWLSPVIYKANCLDLFAGSGALSFEALSRGAASVVMVEQAEKIVAYLKKQVEEMRIDTAKILQATFPDIPTLKKKQFDIVFLDPPFQQGLVKLCATWLEKEDVLKSSAYIYIETERQLEPLTLVPAHWQLLRTKLAGGVAYHLFFRERSD